MKLLMFDFECTSCGHQFEDLVKSDVYAVNCPECDGAGSRTISPVRSDWRTMGLDADFPSASDKWAKMQEQKARKEDSVNLIHY
jgi:putative FmdB family regulatory protein